MTSSSSGPGNSCHYSFKILLIGDTGVGKSSLLVSFISNHLVDLDLSPTIGVDFKIKHLTIADKKLKLTIWDTAGQERFRTLTTSYYRGSQGIILVYDVTKRDTFTNIADVWIKEIELYATNHNCVKVLVGNKADKESERMVTSEEGMAFANEYKCLFLECSAKTRSNVERCFEELALKILEVPELLKEGSAPAKRNILKQKQDQRANHQGGCCS
ncbi:ras-related protein RABC2a-like isoform X1 [Zingiber officinale]|uniref:ras-related protein RABC2a-like isoform X1 n=1 Tax=Zingiber officinale TaxID=94328 RepID=UPI001C4B1B3F|nr:ras-related protein RABC2a-like isoform X1 [Zingiber officinale]